MRLQFHRCAYDYAVCVTFFQIYLIRVCRNKSAAFGFFINFYPNGPFGAVLTVDTIGTVFAVNSILAAGSVVTPQFGNRNRIVPFIPVGIFLLNGRTVVSYTRHPGSGF